MTRRPPDPEGEQRSLLADGDANGAGDAATAATGCAARDRSGDPDTRHGTRLPPAAAVSDRKPYRSRRESARRSSPPGPPSHDEPPPAPLLGRELRERLLTLAEVAELTGVVEKTVRRWILAGRLVARKLGGRWRVHPADYRAFLHAGVTGPGPGSGPG